MRAAQISSQIGAGEQRANALSDLARQRDAEVQRGRYLGRIGTAIEPIFEPIGFGWKESVALLTGFVAKGGGHFDLRRAVHGWR